MSNSQTAEHLQHREGVDEVSQLSRTRFGGVIEDGSMLVTGTSSKSQLGDAATSSLHPSLALRLAPWYSLQVELLELVFTFLPDAADRGAAALVCKSWDEADRRTRSSVTIRNCYAVAPEVAVKKFPKVRAAVVKGRPHFADFCYLPPDWGADALPWVEAATPRPDVEVEGWPLLEELSLKRMVVTDKCLTNIAAGFPNLKVLHMNKCDGFSTTGLAAIAHGCKNLRVLDLEESQEIDDNPSSDWLSNCPESLETLNFSCLRGEINFTELEGLVSRCRNLTTLNLNDGIPLWNVASLLLKAPQIVELGFGTFSDNYDAELFDMVKAAFAGCTSLRRLHGRWDDKVTAYLPAFCSVCEGLTFLNLCKATVEGPGLIDFVTNSKNLLRLWVNCLIKDEGLSAVALACSGLQELRAEFSNEDQPHFTERGLIDISAQCHSLETLLYLGNKMTNAALIMVAKNCPKLKSFRFGLRGNDPDHITNQPFDDGFRVIVESCKDLRRISIAGRLTDIGLKAIGEHANSLEVLSLSFTGDSEIGLHYILKGCKSLKRLQITKCPFDGMSLQANAAKLETLRYLWMDKCSVIVQVCRLLGDTMHHLNVEVEGKRGPEENVWLELGPELGPLDSVPLQSIVRSVYVYRTLVGPRFDAPQSVKIASRM